MKREKVKGKSRKAAAAALMAALLLVSVPAGAAGPSLVDAVKRGNLAEVRALIAKRVDVNAPEADGTTALHWAVHLNNLDLVNLILRSGANVGAANRYGVTPLMLASTNGSAAMIKSLVEAGADVNSVNPEGETVLMTAARTGNPESVSLLVERGANVNAKEKWRGQTALMWAVAERHPAAVRVLLAAGADIHAKTTQQGFTPFLFAVRTGDMEIVRMLLAAGAKLEEPATEGTTPLVLAITNGHYELAAHLLYRGADPNVESPGGTALHAITRTRDYEFGVIHRPAPVPTGRLSDLDLVKVLLDYGANIDAQIVKALPRQGSFDNNFMPLVGATSFFLAARAADPTLMRLLLDYGGASPTLTTRQRITPLMAAAGAGYVQGQSIGAEKDRYEAVKMLLDMGADIHARDNAGETAMHGAATGGVNDVIQLLYDRGAKADIGSKEGWTPLSIANGDRSNFRFWPKAAELLARLVKEEQARKTP